MWTDRLLRNRHRALTTCLCFGALLLLWLGLAVLSRSGSFRAIVWTNRLVGPALGMSLVFLVAWSVAITGNRKLAVFRWGALGLVLLAGWIGLELAGVFGLVDWQRTARLLTAGGITGKYMTDFAADPELGFRRPANARWAGKAVGDIEFTWCARPVSPRQLEFSYDQWGYRNQHGLTNADVLLIGDSFVDGWNVRSEETAARVLERKTGMRTANLGVAGYGPMQELLVLKRESARLKPSIAVWFFFEGNDLYDDFNFERTRLYLSLHREEARNYQGGPPRDGARSWWQRSFAGNLPRAFRCLGDPLVRNQVPYAGVLLSPGNRGQPTYFADYASVPWSDWIEDRWAKARTTFDEGAKFCRESGIKLLLCYVPIKFRVYQQFVAFAPDSPCRNWKVWPLPEEFSRFCQTNSISFLDFTKPLQNALQSGQMPYAAADSHWSPSGHALVAELVAEQLRRDFGLPAPSH